MDMKIELISVPVSDVDRAKIFYTKLGFHDDVDQTISDGRRFVQLTPPGSGCSITVGDGITDMPAGSMNSILLVVSDIEAAYKDFVTKGVKITKPAMQPWGAVHAEFTDPDGNRWSLQQKPKRP
jgi:predicted enzyme related to lactoylglutathione lyase